MDNKVELYHEFLNLMESTNYHDDLITINSEAPIHYDNLPLNLNLDLNINSYYDMLIGKDECTFNPMQYKIPKYEECPTLSSDIKRMAHNSIQLDTEYDEPLSEPECDNPIAPGLFPKMNINDDHQFMKFDRLPIVPSYISK